MERSRSQGCRGGAAPTLQQGREQVERSYSRTASRQQKLFSSSIINRTLKFLFITLGHLTLKEDSEASDCPNKDEQVIRITDVWTEPSKMTRREQNSMNHLKCNKSSVGGSEAGGQTAINRREITGILLCSRQAGESRTSLNICRSTF